ncbi:MAG TPA: Re/Si-specific NAD(P)(+) transhydrogenase subunit alpha [Tepidisphaeraceae bacterium]|jgi:NAD(P) transhydrogenase subunit alpha|nr:Re/Si-specific NAD(P)(+) transhydrogenase subunit alpha [Tepidisphaeraceae bacterium]
MKIFVPNQTASGETRVAMVPAVAKRLAAGTVEVLIESGAGAKSSHLDEAYQVVGAKIVGGEGWGEADIVAVVQPPTDEQVRLMKKGAVLVGMLAPHKNIELIKSLASRGVSAMALELLPRITRAQAMDVLSSQANLAGFKAVILAAEKSPKIFPMLMTAAGTIQPAKVFVIGAGVAGLQAIATARRLGAVVTAYDVRPAVKEQVQSVGAKFLELPLETSGAQDAGGYAKELTPEQQEKQRELMAKAVTESDVVITTAAIPGKPAPRLISADVVHKMLPGSVIVDLAAESGGNCELTEPGKIAQHNGVTIIGITNVPATIPFHASQVYANNVANLLKLLITKEGQLKLDTTDEVIAGALVTHEGQIVHPRVKEMVGNA